MNSRMGLIATVAASFFVSPLVQAAEPKAVSAVETAGGTATSTSAKPAADGDVAHSQVKNATYGPLHKPKTPRVELFLGYSYLHAVPGLTEGNRLVWLNGGSTSVAFNFNRYLGVVGDFGGYADSELNLSGPGASPARVAGSGGKAFTYLAGPRFSYRRSERFTPFAQALFGAAHAGPVTLDGCTGIGCTPLPSQNAFALTAGGGLDLKLEHHLSLRLVQGEYLMTRFADTTTGVKSMQNDIRLSSGLVFRFGGSDVRLPVGYACSASPTSVYPGDPVTITGMPTNLDPKRTPAYTWTTDGGKISGAAETAMIDTSTDAPGSYTAHGHVSEGAKVWASADCTAPFTVMAFQPPTVSCSANPSTVSSGQPATITAQASSPQNRPLTYSYSASGGTVSGTGSSATLDTTAVTSGSIAVTCNVLDDKGQAASSTATVVVQTPVLPPSPVTQQLCSISFDRDSKRPTRVDNEAKACLDDIALNLQRSTDAKVAFVGKGTPHEAAQRAVNAREYLLVDKGIDASRIAVYTEPSDNKAVDSILIPTGAVLDATGLMPIHESVQAIPRSGRSK